MKDISEKYKISDTAKAMMEEMSRLNLEVLKQQHREMNDLYFLDLFGRVGKTAANVINTLCKLQVLDPKNDNWVGDINELKKFKEDMVFSGVGELRRANHRQR